MNHATTGSDKGRSYSGDYMAVGKVGEDVVIKWLKIKPQVLGVTDFRSIREVHEADVDVGVRLYTGQVCLAEIKTDTYLGKSGNIITEVLRINHYSDHKYAGYLGWSFRSPAEHLLFYAPNCTPPSIYKTTFKKYRSVAQLHTKENDTDFMTIRTDSGKTTYNILIPEAEYDGIFTIYPLE